MRRTTVALIFLGFALSVTPTGRTSFFTFTPFDVPFPGANTTDAESINDLGQIIGEYLDPFGNDHGFLRDARGNFFPIEFPLAGGTISNTIARGINDPGVIVGTYRNPADPPGMKTHGFVLSSGVYGPIDVPSSVFPGAFNTRTIGINDVGTIVGSYQDGAAVFPGHRHSFELARGTFSLINVPFAGANNFAQAGGINNLDQIVGSFMDPSGFFHCFLEDQGNFTEINFPGAVETFCRGINDHGQIVGIYVDTSNGIHSFLRSGDNFVTINLPGVIQTVPNGETLSSVILSAFAAGISGVNNPLDISGTFLDADGFHGFLGEP